MKKYITIKVSSQKACWERVGDLIEDGYSLCQMPHQRWWYGGMWRAKMERVVYKGQLETRLDAGEGR